MSACCAPLKVGSGLALFISLIKKATWKTSFCLVAAEFVFRARNLWNPSWWLYFRNIVREQRPELAYFLDLINEVIFLKGWSFRPLSTRSSRVCNQQICVAKNVNICIHAFLRLMNMCSYGIQKEWAQPVRVSKQRLKSKFSALLQTTITHCEWFRLLFFPYFLLYWS